MSKRNKSKGKKINPHYWVFCEGQTEEAYVAFLRSFYRVLIEIVSKIGGSGINESQIKKSKQGKPVHKKDKDFLMYDMDVEAILKRLKAIPRCTLLLSNPSIELWFLYHYKNQTAMITTEKCVRELENRTKKSYCKGELCQPLKEKLQSKIIDATSRAKSSDFHNNPSSNVFLLLEELENFRKSR